MSNSLAVDTDKLSDVGRSLRQLAVEFDRADARSAEAARHVGHDDLADRLERFASEWDGKRASLIGAIAQLGDACTAVAESFEELDGALGTASRGES